MKPIRYETPSGKIIELYTMGEVSRQLGIGRMRFHVLLSEGVLPMTPFKNLRGYRLFSREQIDIFGYYMSRLRRSGRGREFDSWFRMRVKKRHDLLLAEYGLKKQAGTEVKETALSVRAKRYAKRRRKGES